MTDPVTLRQRLRDAWANADQVVERAIADHPEEAELRRLRGAWDRVTLGERSGGADRSIGDWPPHLGAGGAPIVVINDPALRQRLTDAILAYHKARHASLDAGIPLE